MTNEMELVVRAQNGERQAFEELVLAYRKNLTALAFRMIGDRAEAEDIAQDALVKAYIKLSAFNYEREGAFKSWLFTITSRVCIDYVRRRRFRHGPKEVLLGDKLEEMSTGEDLGEGLLQKESRRFVREGLCRLPPNYRMALILRFQEELSYLDIAEIMNIPLGTVGSWLRRGMDQLRRYLIAEGVVVDERAAFE